MTLHDIVKTAEKLTVDNSPAILTAIGVAGTITTALLTAKAAVEADDILRAEVFAPENDGINFELTWKHKIELTWKVWVLPVSVGTITVGTIIFANRIGSRRAAAMATAYVISEKAFDEYKSKVVEKIGVNKEQAVRDEIAQDRADKMGNTTIIVADAKVLCIDQTSGRYFTSTMEDIKSAVNYTNYYVLHDGYASLNDFYDRIGLAGTSYSEEVGWNSDKLMDVLFSTVMSPDNKPCLSMDFTVTPIRNYNKLHG